MSLMRFLFLVRCPRGWRARCIDHIGRLNYILQLKALLYYENVHNFDSAYLLVYIYLEHDQTLFATNGANLVDLTITCDQHQPSKPVILKEVLLRNQC